MNTKNNQRKRNSQKLIEKTFVELLQKKELTEITVTDICKLTQLNRSTFYANYLDIYDLAEKVKEKLEIEVSNLYQKEIEHKYNSNNYLKLFYHIKENQLFYKTYFKLGYDTHFEVTHYDTTQAKTYFQDQFIDYHIEFFKNGLNAIIKLWLKNGCIETPEQICSILESEYSNRKKN